MQRVEQIWIVVTDKTGNKLFAEIENNLTFTFTYKGCAIQKFQDCGTL